MYDCYLTCPRGLEETAQIDLKPFVNTSTIGQGGIAFKVNKANLYKINLHSRIGMHLLIKLFECKSDNINQLYDNIYNFSWHKIIDRRQSFMIKVKGYSNYFNNRNYTTLKIKDAIVDRIKKEEFSRPYIDKKNPDIVISVFISDSQIIVYLDSSGESLHKRGYRNKMHRAALNESLAAGLIMLSNWNKKDTFYDLMCGSGTIPIEAALIAHNIAPGLFRNNFAFQKWNNYDEKLFLNIKKIAKNKIKMDSNIKIYGSDLAFSNIAISLSSIKFLGLEKFIKLRKQAIENFHPSSDIGTIIINPPYGERLKQDDNSLKNLYALIGDTLKNKCIGFNAYIFTSNFEAAKSIGLQTGERVILKNGNLDCRLLYYPIQSGSYNKKGS